MSTKANIGIGIGAGTVLVVTAYATSFKFAKRQNFLVSDQARKDAFDNISEKYDKKTQFQEFILGITYCRRRLLREHCRGDVLEIGAGTGKNIGLFNYESIKSIIFCERSKKMLDIMRRKYAKYRADTNIDTPHKFQSIDSESIPYPENSFDTVIDMFGLCSYDEPIQALNEMNRVCRPDGKILLLEHGKGHKKWLNEYLDKKAPSHAISWGCWWNRDIQRMVRLAGLKCTEDTRYHFGTTQARVCSPMKG